MEMAGAGGGRPAIAGRPQPAGKRGREVAARRLGRKRPTFGGSVTERIDRERSRSRIERDVETLAGPAYTSSASAICRYAYTDEYRATLAYFTSELEQIGFRVWQDPVGTLVASNVEPG